MSQRDVHVEHAAFVHTSLWTWNCGLPLKKVVIGRSQSHVSQVFLLQVRNLAVYPFQGCLSLRVSVCNCSSNNAPLRLKQAAVASLSSAVEVECKCLEVRTGRSWRWPPPSGLGERENCLPHIDGADLHT